MSFHGHAIEQLANENLMPSQWIEMHASRQIGGEMRLWWACLEQAVREYQTLWRTPLENAYRREWRERTRRELDDWIESNAGHLGSFRFVCDALGVDADELRGRLAQIKTADVQIPRRSPSIAFPRNPVAAQRGNSRI
jgi:hypothetical protein